MRVVRYSIHGFEPQFQSYHKRSMDWYLNLSIRDFLIKFSDYDRIQKHKTWKRIQEHKDFIKKHYLNNLYGVWVFIDGHVNKMALNHLHNKVPNYSADLPDDTICYDMQNDWVGKLSDKRATYFGVFIPASQLNNIKNVKRNNKKIFKNEKKNN